MDLTAINRYLDPEMTRRRDALETAVCVLEPAIAAGVVRNKDFVNAKHIVNRVVEEAAEAFLKSTSHDKYYAYHADALVFGAHTLPTVIRRAREAGLDDYADFVETALLPLRSLLEQAKPLVKKRGEEGHPPEPKTPKQVAREAAQMTCQCCGGLFLANTGLMAHHGYRRPGDGWQTASCSGAKELPFEVSRDKLGAMIDRLKDWLSDAVYVRGEVEAERIKVALTYTDKTSPGMRYGDRPKKTVHLDRESFDAVRQKVEAEQGDETFSRYGWDGFDKVKAADIRVRDYQIHATREEIAALQARYDGWKQTHQWSVASEKWEAIVDG